MTGGAAGTNQAREIQKHLSVTRAAERDKGRSTGTARDRQGAPLGGSSTAGCVHQPQQQCGQGYRAAQGCRAAARLGRSQLRSLLGHETVLPCAGEQAGKDLGVGLLVSEEPDVLPAVTGWKQGRVVGMRRSETQIWERGPSGW